MTLFHHKPLHGKMNMYLQGRAPSDWDPVAVGIPLETVKDLQRIYDDGFYVAVNTLRVICEGRWAVSDVVKKPRMQQSTTPTLVVDLREDQLDWSTTTLEAHVRRSMEACGLAPAEVHFRIGTQIVHRLTL